MIRSNASSFPCKWQLKVHQRNELILLTGDKSRHIYQLFRKTVEYVEILKFSHKKGL